MPNGNPPPLLGALNTQVIVYKCLHDMAPPYLSELCRQAATSKGAVNCAQRLAVISTSQLSTIYMLQTGLFLRWPSSMELFTCSFEEQFRRLLKSFLFF